MRPVAILLLGLVSSLSAQQTGQPLPPWTPGTLDIHQINTGRGNSALLIFPDGTSMLIDAAMEARCHREAHQPGRPPPGGQASGSRDTRVTC